MKTHLSLTYSGWTKQEIESLNKHKQQLFDIEKQRTVDKILLRETNQMNFYKICPKEDLPKSLQKMNFQTMNTKQSMFNIQCSECDIDCKNFQTVKNEYQGIQNQENAQTERVNYASFRNVLALQIRYKYLDDPLQNQISKVNSIQVVPISNLVNELDEWEKISSKNNTFETRFCSGKFGNNCHSEQSKRSSIHKKDFSIKKFKMGSDHRVEVQRNLQAIYKLHSDQSNLVSRCALIQSDSKLLKKELEQMRYVVQKEMEEKMKKITQSRKEHHRLYEQKLRLNIEEQEIDAEKDKQEGFTLQSLGFSYHSQENMKTVFEDKKLQIEKNEAKIMKVKKNIQLLEQQTIKNQEQLKNIFLAETAYYKTSLKNGVDCRDSGLVWITKKLGVQECGIPHTDFPQYLDKKSKLYLASKSQNEDLLDDLLKQKREFVNEIGKQNQGKRSKRSSVKSRKSSIKLQGVQKGGFDEIKEITNSQKQNQIPKRYRQSVRKITALREQYFKNQSILKLNQSRNGFKFGLNMNGLTTKQVYNTITHKIKQVDFSKLKKQKMCEKRDKIYDYQSILRKIEDLHMQMEENEIQQENYLLSQFRDDKNSFFMIASACFGVKRAYSLIIKNFSWKNVK